MQNLPPTNQVSHINCPRQEISVVPRHSARVSAQECPGIKTPSNARGTAQHLRYAD